MAIGSLFHLRGEQNIKAPNHGFLAVLVRLMGIHQFECKEVFWLTSHPIGVMGR